MNTANIQLVMPLNIEALVPEDDSVRLLSQIVEEMDLRSLRMAYSLLERNPAYPPRILLKIVLYSYMERIFGTRRIEKACRRDINFMWLLEGSSAPDHNTISRFRKERLSHCIADILKQFAEKLYEYGEIRFENLFVDGTKVEANANKYSFVWAGSNDKFDEKLLVKIRTLAEKINAEFETGFQEKDYADLKDMLRAVSQYLLDQKEKSGDEFVNGKGRRKTRLQKLSEESLCYLEKKTNYDVNREILGDRNSFSKTDHDATFMHMKDDHMRNAQLKPGYNMQIGVESGYVIGCAAFTDRNDVGTLIPFLDQIQSMYDYVIPNVIADSGYESEENYDYLKKNRQTAYIKPQMYEKWKKKSFKKIIGKRENMKYDEESDTYTCQNGRLLPAVRTYEGKTSRSKKSKYKTTYTEYECEDCSGCTIKSKCTKAAGNRVVKVSKKFLKLQKESLESITSPLGIVLRMNRSIQVEGAFGAIKEDAGFRRFMTRGTANILTEFTLLCLAMNMNKLHSRILNNQCGETLLHKKELQKTA